MQKRKCAFSSRGYFWRYHFFRLEKLSAKENPFADEDDFRLVSLLKCDTLTRINKEDVNEGERAEARQMSDEQVEE